MTAAEKFEEALTNTGRDAMPHHGQIEEYLPDWWIERIRSAHAEAVEEARRGSAHLRAHVEHRPSVERIRKAHSWFPVSNAASLTEYERERIPGVGHRVYCQSSADAPEGCYICALLAELEHEREHGLREGASSRGKCDVCEALPGEAAVSRCSHCDEERDEKLRREGAERLESCLNDVLKWALTEDREIFLRRLRSLLDSEQVIRARSGK